MCLTLETAETQESEFSALERIPNNHSKIVLSLDGYQRVACGGIRHGNLREWLLEAER